MADNDLFPDKEDAPAAPAQPAVDTEAISNSIRNSIAPAFNQMRQELADLKAAVAQPAQPQPGKGAEDDYAALINAPRKFAQEIARETVQEENRRGVAPALLQILAQSRDTALAAEEADIDKVYGEGFFAKEVRPKVEVALKEMPAEKQADRTTVNAIVSAVIGMELRNPERFEELSKKRGDTNRKRQEAPGLVGAGRARPSPTKLSEAETAFIAGLNKSGVEYSPGEYLKDRETPGTLSAWSARIKSEKAATK
jgi:hypothetical protein